MKQTITESSLEPLINYFNNYLPLTEEERDIVAATFRPRLYRRKQYVLQEGDICTQFNFVVRGCLRMYKIDEQGNTHILQFATENNWINDLGSFHQVRPSLLNIDALEDTMVFQISHEDIRILYSSAPKFDRIFRVLIENGFIRLQERLLQNISSTAEERYDSFVEVYPHLVSRISQVQIASFIGITPEFLSRLRSRKLKSGKPNS